MTLFDRFLGRAHSGLRLTRWDAGVIFGGYVVLLLIYFVPLIVDGKLLSSTDSDMVAYWLWKRMYLGQMLSSGVLPIIDPYVMSGAPFLASGQTGVFYPPNWLFAVVPTVFLINIHTIFHFWLGLTSTHILARRLGRSTEGATIAALVFGFSAFAVLHWWAGHLVFVLELPWTPLAILAWISTQQWASSPRHERRFPRSVLTLAAVLAVQFFGGQPQISYFTILILCGLQLGWVIWGLLRSTAGDSIGPVVRGTLCLAAAGIGMILLVAVQAFPTYYFLQETSRGETPLHELQVHSLPPFHALMIAAGNAFGNDVSLPYLASGTVMRSLWEIGCFIGATTIVLCIIAVLVGGRSGAGFRWTLVGIAVFGYWLALGEHGGLHKQLLGILPGLDIFRAPGRFVYLGTLAAALLAASGLDRIRERLEDERTGESALYRVLAGISCLFIVGAVINSILFYKGAETPFFLGLLDDMRIALPAMFADPAVRTRYYDALQTGLLAAVVICGLVLMCIAGMRKPGIRPYMPAAIALTLIVELTWYAWPYRASFTVRDVTWTPAVIEKLQAEGSRWRLGSSRLIGDRAQGSVHRVRHVWGVDPLISKEYHDAMLESQRMAGRFRYVPQSIDVIYSTPLTRALGMRWLLVPPTMGYGGTIWKESVKDDLCMLLEDPGALPRGYTVGKVRTVEPSLISKAVNSTDFEPTNTVLLIEPPPPGPWNSETTTVSTVGPGSVAILLDEPERFAAEVDMRQPGWFVLMDRLHGGWAAQVDGAPTKMHSGNAVGRAIPLTAGKHKVSMTYSAPGLRVGMWISALSWMSLGLVLFVTTIMRKRNSTYPEEQPATLPNTS